MKLYQVITTAVIFGMFGCKKIDDQVKIIGKINGEVPEEIFYTIPSDGICNYVLKKSLKPDSAGNFEIALKIDKPSFIKLSVFKKASGIILVEKQMNYQVRFNLELEENQFTVSGKNEEGQNELNKLEYSGSIQSYARQYLKDTSAYEIKEKIRKTKENYINKFEALASNGKISGDFLELVKLDRECYYSLLQGTVALIKKYQDGNKNNGSFSTEISEMWQEAFNGYPPTEKELLRSPWYFEYADNFIKYNEYTHDSFNLDSLQEVFKMGLIHTHNIDESSKHLSSEMLEYHNASYLYIKSFQKRYEKELIALFEEFELKNPNSKFNESIETLIMPIIEYHEVKENEFTKNIKFIDGYESMNTLNEVTNTLKGKKIYIDIWATWCGPCKEEFAYKAGLDKLLVENNVELLYISIDENEKKKQWKEMIKFYKLEGHHVLANESLELNLRELFTKHKGIAIPWYLIIDEGGNIKTKYASKPSELNSLRRELNTI